MTDAPLTLREITDLNRDAVLALRLAPGQERFVSSVADSLEEADEYRDVGSPWYRAVYLGDEPVGFVMLSWNVVPRPPDIIGPWFLWKLLVDERYQRRGIGRRIVERVVELVRAEGGTELLTSHVDAPGGPAGFYERLGFVPTGARDPQGEIILSLDLLAVSIFEAAGGMDGMRRLAAAWHARVMADEIVSHAFSHGFHPQHTDRLAAYWAEALGGPPAYTDAIGDETSVVRMHSGNGVHTEMDERAIACFDQALTDTGLAADDRLRQALHDYFAWATIVSMARYPDAAVAIPDGLSIPHWSWDGLEHEHPG
jgi:hemoglobin